MKSELIWVGQGLKFKLTPAELQQAKSSPGHVFKGSTAKLKTRITEDSYVKPSPDAENDYLVDAELAMEQESMNENQ